MRRTAILAWVLAPIAAGSVISLSVLPAQGQTDLSSSGSLPLYRPQELPATEEDLTLGEEIPDSLVLEENDPVLVNVLVIHPENERGIMYYWGIPQDSIVRGDIGKRSSFLCDGEEVLTTGIVLESRVSYRLSDSETSKQYVDVWQTTYDRDVLIGSGICTRMVFDVPGDDTSVYVCMGEIEGAEQMVVELNEFLITPTGEPLLDNL